MFPKKLSTKLNQRKTENAFRQLGVSHNLIDFSSNDYLGFARSQNLFEQTHQYLLDANLKENGATGSRLLTGNNRLYHTLESLITDFHNCESALVFNSGYDTNLGLFSSVPQRNDIVLYDELCHASIRDGIRMGQAKAYKFKHNDLTDLENQLNQLNDDSVVYVVTESVFSMDGDSPDLKSMADLCHNYKAYFIVDEAHAIGVFGANGIGLISELGLEHRVFARIVTFGKALGCHGAALLGSQDLKDYLVNFSRPLMYSTGLTPHSLASIIVAYTELSSSHHLHTLKSNIQFFNSELDRLHLSPHFIENHSAIHCCIIQGNSKVKAAASLLKEKGFDVKPILSPTVPIEQERLRFCLHSYNTTEEISKVLNVLATFVI